MYGTSSFLLRCLCWFGAYSVTVFQLKVICCIMVFFLQLIWGVRLIVTQTNRRLIFFLHCTTSDELWSLVWQWLGISLASASELRHHFIQFTKMAGMPIFSHTFFTIICFVTVWVIWKERNNRVFQSSVSPPFILIEKVRLHSFLWLKSKHTAFAYSYQDWCKYPILYMGVLL